MKKIILFFLVFMNQTTSSINFDFQNYLPKNLNVYKWSLLTTTPLIYAGLAINAIIKSARTNDKSTNIIDLQKKEEQQKQIESELPSITTNLSINPNDQHKQIKEELKRIEIKCALCQSFRNSTYFILLTYGSILNLLDKIIEKDPGTFKNITLKPFLNAVIMYCASYLINITARYKLLND
jgi:hypothetical protein